MRYLPRATLLFGGEGSPPLPPFHSAQYGTLKVISAHQPALIGMGLGAFRRRYIWRGKGMLFQGSLKVDQGGVRFVW